jgi:hypothetical protein
VFLNEDIKTSHPKLGVMRSKCNIVGCGDVGLETLPDSDFVQGSEMTINKSTVQEIKIKKPYK